MSSDQPLPPDVRVSGDDLTPGRTVYRWTDATRAGVFAPLPCHDGQAVKLDPRWAGVTVLCRVCSESYVAELLPDSDGGHTAVFVVTVVPVLLSRTRRG